MPSHDKKFDPDFAEMALDEHSKGTSFDDIAEMLDITPEYARKLIKKHYGMDGYRACIASAKEARKKIIHAQMEDIVLKGRHKINKLLDEDAIDDPKDLCAIEKTYGDRIAIAKGEPTESAIQIVVFNKPNDTE
jgi:hypothetical protein